MADIVNETSSANVRVLFLRTLWIFQAIIAGVVFVTLGLYSLYLIAENYYPMSLYDFIRSFFSSLLAGSIIVTVVVQRKLHVSSTPQLFTRNCELYKSCVATIFWIWWFIDAFIGPDKRGSRVVIATMTGIASLLLFVLFYPTAYYATFILKDGIEEGQIRLDGDVIAQEVA